jgi:hypothetical protein
MSARDYELYHRRLKALQGRKSFVTLATNSIKLHIDENKKNGTYLWLDPPWEFRRHAKTVESSYSCPDHTDSDYAPRFRRWCRRFDSMSESTIATITATPDGALQIAFTSGEELVLPANETKQPDSWYDHWYYNEPAKA